VEKTVALHFYTDYQGYMSLSPVTIAGTGSYLPEKVLTNADLEKIVDTTDEWITSRTGIKERRIAAEGQSTSDLATEAAKKANSSYGLLCTG